MCIVVTQFLLSPPPPPSTHSSFLWQDNHQQSRRASTRRGSITLHTQCTTNRHRMGMVVNQTKSAAVRTIAQLFSGSVSFSLSLPQCKSITGSVTIRHSRERHSASATTEGEVKEEAKNCILSQQRSVEVRKEGKEEV